MLKKKNKNEYMFDFEKKVVTNDIPISHNQFFQGYEK